MSSFFQSLRFRLPGGVIFHDLVQSAKDYRYGMKVTFARFLYHLAVYCFGSRRIRRNRAIAVLKPPYPVFYHFTAASNTESIKEKGLLPNHGKVWITDCVEPYWTARFSGRAPACFRIDSERLISSGHTITAMEHSHEFTTDYVPPCCLSVYHYY